jgi:hypothetical protein
MVYVGRPIKLYNSQADLIWFTVPLIVRIQLNYVQHSTQLQSFQEPNLL